MYASKEWLEASMTMLSYEKTLLKYTRLILDTNYQNMIPVLLQSNYSKEEQIRMLASWDLPVTLGSFNYPDEHLKAIETTLMLLKAGKRISERHYDGIIAKAIQSLNYHREFSYKDFVTS